MKPAKAFLQMCSLCAVVTTGFLQLRAALPAAASSTETDSRTSQIIYLNNRGAALLDQYKFKEAVKQFEQIVQIDPEVLPAYVNLGIAYFYDQKYQEALAAFDQVFAKDPNEIHSHYVRGLIFRNQDEVENAIQAFTAVHKQDSLDPSTNYYLGRMYMRLREYEKAASYFQMVIDEEPYNASAHYNLSTAFARSGKREEGRRELEEFKRLQDLFGSTTVGLQYLEQGKYAIAIDSIDRSFLPRPAGEEEPRALVTFVEVAEKSGLAFRHSGPGDPPDRFQTLGEMESRVVPALGSGIACADYDGDGWLDFYLANAGPSGSQGALYRNRGDGSFEATTAAAGLSQAAVTMHALWGDYDNDSYPDLYLINYGPNVLYRNRQDGTFEDVTAATGTGDKSWGLGGAFVDYDHDGDLDIFVANFSSGREGISAPAAFPGGLPGAPNRLYRNTGKGSFTDVSEASGLAGGNQRTVSVITSDLNDTRDVDFLLINNGAPSQMLRNLRDGSFRPVEIADLSRAGDALGAAVGDLNSDGQMDLALPSQEGETAFLVSRGHDRYDLSKELSGLVQGPLLNVQFFDFDNDGDQDVLALSAKLFGGEKALSRNRNIYILKNEQGKYRDVSTEVGVGLVSGKPVRGLSIADYDADGDLDFAVTVNGSSPLLFRNDGGNANRWLSVRLSGSNSNRSGVGVKAEIRAGDLWMRVENVGGQGYLTQNSPILHFGLGRHQQADVVRLLWPNGVLQSEIDTASNQTIEIRELDRKGTSCPILYVWNGETFQFQTDFLGGSAYGSLLAPGVFNYPDTDEYVKLNPSHVELRNGRVVITMNNQLEEVILFDQVELLVVDHPADYEVFPDEKLLPGPPYAEFRLYSASSPRPPVAAFDGGGRPVLKEISQIDRTYPEISDRQPFKGYTDLHELVLDLGDVSEDYAVLLLHAWIDYADSSSNLAASQAGLKLVPPYLQVRDEAGNWVTAIERMGFPAGLPKTMTVDLSGIFRSSSRQIRIATNMKIYWDQVLIATGKARSDYRVHRLSAEAAELRERGFPRPFSPDGNKPDLYDYTQDSKAEWKVHVGAYTKLGDVLPLLRQRDDMFVITRSGDEVEVAFDQTGLPPLPEGWKRDYLVYVDGFGKDMDPNSAAPSFLGPLPFHEMTAFPYPDTERYPGDPAYQEYLRIWNTRVFERAVPDLPRVPVD